MYHATGFQTGDQPRLRQEALYDAYKMCYRDIYRSMMRYGASENAEALGLTPCDVQEFEAYEHKETEATRACRYVVVSLPREGFEEYRAWYHNIARKCSQKIYVGKCWYCLEFGKDENHPHYNFFFYSDVKWLAKSRIINEFASTFQIEKNYVNVKSVSKNAESEIVTYMGKEGVPIFTNFGNPIKKKKSKKDNEPAE